MVRILSPKHARELAEGLRASASRDRIGDWNHSSLADYLDQLAELMEQRQESDSVKIAKINAAAQVYIVLIQRGFGLVQIDRERRDFLDLLEESHE